MTAARGRFFYVRSAYPAHAYISTTPPNRCSTRERAKLFELEEGIKAMADTNDEVVDAATNEVYNPSKVTLLTIWEDVIQKDVEAGRLLKKQRLEAEGECFPPPTPC